MPATRHTTADALLTAFRPFLTAAREEFGPGAARLLTTARPALASALRTLAALLRLLAARIDRPARTAPQPAAPEPVAPVAPSATSQTPEPPAPAPVPYGWGCVDLPTAPAAPEPTGPQVCEVADSAPAAPEPAEEPQVWTVATVSRVLGVPGATVKKHAAAGHLKGSKTDAGAWVFSDRDVNAYIEWRNARPAGRAR